MREISPFEPWFFILFGLFHLHRVWGLLDRENMVGSVEYDPSQRAYVLTVSDEAPFQEEEDAAKGDALSDVVQIPIRGYNQPGPRPFTQPTEDECISSGRALEAFNAGMRRRGHEIEIF